MVGHSFPALAGLALLGFGAPFLAGRYWPDGSGPSRGLQVKAGPGFQTLLQARRVALVIGNGAYPACPLRNPVNDARAMALTLQKCGFQVSALEDAGKRQMQEAIRAFGDRIDQGCVGIFYFAGHGLQVGARNFLVPVGANIAREDDVDAEAVPLQAVLARMGAARNPLNICIVDACLDNPFSRGLSEGVPFVRETAPAGTYLAFATAPGGTAGDGGGAHSVYTAALLRQLQAPDLELEEVFRRTRAEVLQVSGSRQVPWEDGTMPVAFHFHGADPLPAAPASAAPFQVPAWTLAASASRVVSGASQDPAGREAQVQDPVPSRPQDEDGPTVPAQVPPQDGPEPAESAPDETVPEFPLSPGPAGGGMPPRPGGGFGVGRRSPRQMAPGPAPAFPPPGPGRGPGAFACFRPMAARRGGFRVR
jgi:hypothetical protein